MTDHDSELDAILDQVEAAGLVEVYTDSDGQQAMRLTPEGERVVHQLAMLGEEGQDELMEGLLQARDDEA
jgi:DNA-binding MarR family transcriptional regulator